MKALSCDVVRWLRRVVVRPLIRATYLTKSVKALSLGLVKALSHENATANCNSVIYSL